MECPHREIFFGGARGGGKTDGVLGKWAADEQRYGDQFNAVMFRRTTVSAEDAIERSRQIYVPLGGKFNETRNVWRMPRGGRVSFAYLERTQDADEYQGRNVTHAWVEEAGQYPSPDPILRLFGVLRSAAGVPTQLIVTANPGGAGQHWIRDRYGLHPFPRRPKVVTKVLDDGSVHKIAVIPSRITDNRILLDNDPDYLTNLKMVGSKELIRAWLEGDWSAVQGAFFDNWRESRNVVEPFAIPEHWLRFTSMDWGFARPSSVGWWAVASDDTQKGDIIIPRGALVRYRELYTAASPNVGLRMTSEELADKIRMMEMLPSRHGERAQYETIGYRVADPAIFASDGGPSIGERMAMKQVLQRPADNTRVGKSGAMGGWDQMRVRIDGEDEKRPMLVVFSTCKDFIRTVPVLQHDPSRPEDLDTSAEDHVGDETRYACLSRPWVASKPRQKQAEVDTRMPTLNEVVADFEKGSRNRNGRIW